ncbi:MAG: MraY family glycosyltransferase [Sulfurimonadaceae bacterium]
MILEFSIIFVVALILIKLIIINALKLGLVDVPNERSIHTRHHPRGAGIGIYLAVALVDPWFNFSILIDHYMVFLAVLLVFIVGVLDDHQDTSQNTKFFVMTFAALFVYFDGIYVSTLGTLFGFDMSLGWFALPFTVIAIVGFTNALNLIDGLDGLAGSISIVILSTLFIIGYDNGDDFMMMLSGSFIAGLLAFMVYNWNPASIFMGDSGSLVLGFVIGLLVIKSASYVHPVSVLFIIAVPLLDTIIVMFRRMRQGKSMFIADKTHLHHVLFKFFNRDVKTAVIFLAILQLTYSMTGLLIVDSADQSMSLVLFGLNVSILYFVFSGMLRRQIIIDKQSKEKP